MKTLCRSAVVWMVACLAFGAAAATRAAAAGNESAADRSTRQLLEALDDRQMPDVMLWVLDRVAADPAAAPSLKQEVPFRRATALVGLSRTESDAAKRVKMLDDAEAAIDKFLKDVPAGPQAIDAYSQKGNLLIERGRTKLEEAKRPGAKSKDLNAEAVKFFDAAIKSLQGSAKPDVEIKQVTNAEDAAVAAYRDAKKKLDDLKAADKDEKDKPGRKPPKRSAAAELELERLEDEAESLQTKIVQTRLMVAGIHFEKAKAFDKGSPEWTASLEKSTELFQQIAKKYPTRGGGFFAKYYEGRNLAVQGKYPEALQSLGVLTAIDDKKPIAILLRSKALNTSLECWLAQKKPDGFTDDLRKFALTPLPPARLDADWLGLKFRGAQALVARAEALPEKEKSKKPGLLKDANTLAADVVKANREFSKEARELLAGLGKALPGAGVVDTFDGLMDDVRAAVTVMQAKQAEAKQAKAAGKPDAEALKAAGVERDRAIGLIRKAMRVSDGEDDASVNQARYLLTYLLYEARRLPDAAMLGTFLAERYPNAKGSRQAAKIAMACWQQLQTQPETAWAKDARAKTIDVAGLIVRTWPSEAESGDAAVLMVGGATEAGDVGRLLAIAKSVPKEMPRRPEVLQRVGTAVLREVSEQRRHVTAGGAEDKKLADWKAAAKSSLDEGLAAVKEGPPAKVTVAAALSRCQLAIEDGDLKRAGELLEHPIYGPWTVARGKDPAFNQGPLAEGTLTVALRYYIQGEKLDKAQQAMESLEKVVGDGDQASAKLTNLYFAMGRDLQLQLEALGAGGKAGSPEVRARAEAILGGFEKFLDGLVKRDRKITSQMWVATTYLTLGSGQGTGAVVSKARADKYLDLAAGVFGGLLKRKSDAGVAAEERQQIEKFEPAIRLKMARIYGELGRWAEADQQMDWILADAQRQNSLEAQIEAAELSEAAGRSLASKDPQQADAKYREATAGRKSGASVVWGWGNIANKLTRQAFGGSDEKALKAREQFFDARFHVASCLFERGRLSGRPPAELQEMLKKSQSAIATTYRLYPEMGGEATRARFEKLLKEIQKSLGVSNPGGFRDLEPPVEAAPAAANASR